MCIISNLCLRLQNIFKQEQTLKRIYLFVYLSIYFLSWKFPLVVIGCWIIWIPSSYMAKNNDFFFPLNRFIDHLLGIELLRMLHIV